MKLKTEIRRQLIADAALRIIARQGVGGLTTAGLAREAGISEANLYRHYGSKDEILAEIVQRIAGGMKENLEQVSSIGSDDAGIERLKRLFMLHLDYVQANEGIPRLVFSEELHINHVHLRQSLLDAITSYASAIETIIRDGQQDGSIKVTVQPKEGALTLIGMVQVSIVRWSLSGFRLNLVDEGMKLWTHFASCLLTPGKEE